MICTTYAATEGLVEALVPRNERREKEEYARKRSTELVPEVHVGCQNKRVEVFQNGTVADDYRCHYLHV